MKRVLSIAAAMVGLAVVIAICLRGGSVPHDNAGEAKLRIVSIAPSVTEILFAVGAGDCVVGVTDRCDYPPEAKDIESVGGFGAPSMEKLLSLSPALVIGTGVQRSDVTERLQSSGIRMLWVKTGNFAETFETLRTIGREVAKAGRSEQVVSDMQAELDTIAEKHGDIPDDRRPRVFVEIWSDPMTTAGKGSFVDELVTQAGGVNVAHEIDAAYPTVNPEKVVEWDPDVIVLGYMNQQEHKDSLAGRIGWANIKAIRSGNIINDIPSDRLLRPGPRLIEGVKALHRHLYGAAADAPAPQTRPSTPDPAR